MDPNPKEKFYLSYLLGQRDDAPPQSPAGGNIDDTSFLFDHSHGRQQPLPMSHTHLRGHFSQRGVVLWWISIGLIFSIIFGRLVQLQLLHGYEYRQLAEGNRQRVVPIPAERGLIFDRVGRQLTKNVPKFSLVFIPQDLPRGPEPRRLLVDRLTVLTEIPREDIERLITEFGSYSYESIIIKENLDYDTALSLYIAAADLPGIGIERGSKRLYSQQSFLTKENEPTSTPFTSLSHILGYVGKLNPTELQELRPRGYRPSDSLGKIGVEKTYESILRGTYGNQRIEVNAQGKQQAVITEQGPEPGHHLTLTIDAAMQQTLETLLREALAKAGATKAAAVALDPRSGDVFALVSLPDFDNNDFSGGITSSSYQSYLDNPNQPLFHRAISGTYPSGSTIKPALAAAALEEGIIRPLTTIQSQGGLQIGQWFFPDWKIGGHGPTNVRKSIAWSVNTFYYYIGGGYGTFLGLGVDRLTSYLHRFGFGEATGIDLPGEAAGLVPTKAWKQETVGEPWYIGDTYNLSIGQGHFLATPLQIAMMTATIANGGTLYHPRVVKEIVNPVNTAIQKISPSPLRSRVIGAEHLTVVQRGMRDCVVYGSCQRLASLPMNVAGKTGTAEWRRDHKPHAWFTSFAPAEEPEVVLTILIEEAGEGSAVAVPVAERFYRWWWNYQREL